MPEVRRNSDKILKIASQNHWLKKSQIKKNNNKKLKKHNKTKKKQQQRMDANRCQLVSCPFITFTLTEIATKRIQ